MASTFRESDCRNSVCGMAKFILILCYPQFLFVQDDCKCPNKLKIILKKVKYNFKILKEFVYLTYLKQLRFYRFKGVYLFKVRN